MSTPTLSRLPVSGPRSFAALALLLAACGGKVVVDAAPSGGSGAGAGTGVGGTGGGSTTTVGAGGASGVGGDPVLKVPCSNEEGVGCPDDQFCDYADDLCGKKTIHGICTPRPLGCPPTFQPTCGCDAAVYNTPCDAQREGTDLSAVTWCVPPAGMWQCGTFFCTVGKEFCEHQVVDQGASETASCKPLPACGASCDCLLSTGCGSSCGFTPEGGIEVFCPAGL
jgi:hypothetical protein